MFYQLHEHHGKHIAYSPQEAESNENNGWKTVSEDEFYGKKEPELTEDVIKKYEEIFGKKPHHKMKPETILEKINGHSE